VAGFSITDSGLFGALGSVVKASNTADVSVDGPVGVTCFISAFSGCSTIAVALVVAFLGAICCGAETAATVFSMLVFVSFLAMTGFASCVFCSGSTDLTCAGCLITRLFVPS